MFQLLLQTAGLKQLIQSGGGEQRTASGVRRAARLLSRRWLSGETIQSGVQVTGNEDRIVANTIDQGRLAGAHERQAHCVEAWKIHDTGLVNQVPLAIEDWQI